MVATKDVIMLFRYLGGKSVAGMVYIHIDERQIKEERVEEEVVKFVERCWYLIRKTFPLG